MSAQAEHSTVRTTFLPDAWQWVLGIWRQLLRITPRQASTCVLLFIVSQGMLLAALLLPWKLLIILNSDTFPSVLPGFLMSYGTRELILALSTAALVSFLLHLICEAGISYVCGRGARSVINLHRKTGLFNNHRQQAAQLYRRLLRSLAVIAFCILVALWLLLTYPLLFLAFASYLCFGLGLIAADWWRRLSVPPEYRPSSQLLAKAWWGGGFLYAVGWVIGDYWRGDFPGIMIAFISLLLVRQALAFLTQLVQNLLLLLDQRSKVDALFLAETPWVPKAHGSEDFQALLQPTERELWVRRLLAHHTDAAAAAIDISCRAAEAGQIIYVTARCMDDEAESAFLLKLYHRSNDALAQHEKEILQVANASWPAPRILGDHFIEGHTCFVFKWSPNRRWLNTRERVAELLVLRERLLKCSVPDTLISRYDRSQPSLSRRLQDVDWSLLISLAPSEADKDLCKIVQASWPCILKDLDLQPRQVVLSKLDRRMMSADKSDAPIICNWTRWRWDPVGAGWPFRQRDREQLRGVLQRASQSRSELRAVDAEQAYNTAMLYEFERCVAARDFVTSLSLIEPICENLGLLRSSKKAETAAWA